MISTKHLLRNSTNATQSLLGNGRERTTHHSFCEATTIWMSDPDEDFTRKQNYSLISIANINQKQKRTLVNRILRYT